MTVQDALQQVSLVCANFGNAQTFRAVLNDWIGFLGGKPGEVVVVDGGSDAAMQSLCWEMFQSGEITKLQIIRSNHPDNHKDLCFIQEHTAGAIATRPYLLFYKSDTLPFRKGHENWLPEAIEFLERPDTFAVGGSFNIPSKHHDAWPGYYFSHKCSENFAFMKRSSFIAAMEEFAGKYIASGFTGESPAASTGQARYLVEVAFEKYIERHQRYTLVREEDPSWTVFHTNVAGEKLVQVRQDYLQRIDIERYMNAATISRMPGGTYYGRRPSRWVEMKLAFGESVLGSAWRSIKRCFCGGSRVTR